jgi:hypothetical protein
MAITRYSKRPARLGRETGRCFITTTLKGDDMDNIPDAAQITPDLSHSLTDSDPLTARALNLSMSLHEQTNLPMRGLAAPLQRLIGNLALDDDDKCEAFIRLMRLIDHADDDDKCMITSLAIECAYAQTANHRHSLQEYLADLGNQSHEYADLEALITKEGR